MNLTPTMEMADFSERAETSWYYFTMTFLACAVFDWAVLRPCVRAKAQYFVLHFVFNTFVAVTTAKECAYSLTHPFEIFNVSFTTASVSTTVCIGAFHMYHLVASMRALGGKGLSKEETIHHTVSGIFVPIIGVFFPFGCLISIVNFFMCGLPGGIDYLMLALVKYDVIDKITEKRINRHLNLLLRMPAMMAALYMLLLNLWHGNLNRVGSPLSILIMMFAAFLHTFNAIYYCDKVVGNYHVSKMKETAAAKKSK